jgi:hypothetical protein
MDTLAGSHSCTKSFYTAFFKTMDTVACIAANQHKVSNHGGLIFFKWRFVYYKFNLPEWFWF